MKWFYLSYAGKKFRGAAILRAESVEKAAEQARLRGISPGGQVLGLPIPNYMLPAWSYRNRLLTREDIDQMFPGGGMRLADAQASGRYDMEAFDKATTVICAECEKGLCKVH